MQVHFVGEIDNQQKQFLRPLVVIVMKEMYVFNDKVFFINQ